MKLAIVGTGVAGLYCAHLLDEAHEVTLFEADPRPGGHVNTVEFEHAGERHAIDTGFIVHNDRNYPLLTSLFRELGVATQPSEMSFSVSDQRSGLEYKPSNLNSLFAQRRNIARPAFYSLISDIVRFNRAGRRLVAQPDDDGSQSLEQFIAQLGLSRAFRDHFLVPFGASVWSADPSSFLQFPARSYLRFMDNHGLLGLTGHPQWRTITGGSQRYVDALLARFSGQLRCSTPVERLSRLDNGRVDVAFSGGREEFDGVIVAAHADQALSLLAEPTPSERELLGAIRFQPNRATLHTDDRLLPREHRARAAWNYFVPTESSGRATLSYSMNRLQAIDSEHQFIVTLNSDERIDPERVIASFDYSHPVYDGPSVAARARIAELQGTGNIYYAGAYWEDGFHEDGARSAAQVAARLMERP
ncbi:MAG: NAD(P)-binding protein [Actinobacteria bacterium]|uniref:Unannotated protein n=1 Tax=freshwater metagenome TaxID=449393 RepID=A0A6J5ZKT0_9ZZZZ|nr:NAD(P)-binding protein [Actinomycetota bacterium]